MKKLLLTLILGVACSIYGQSPYYNGKVEPAVQFVEGSFEFPISKSSVNIVLGEYPNYSARMAKSILEKQLKFVSALKAPTLNVYLTEDANEVGHVEGYKIKVDDDGIHIIGNDNRGMFYGAMTLLQQIDPQNSRIVTANILDYPTWQHRYVTDLFAIKTENLPEFLAKWKINGYAYQMATSWRDVSPTAKSQWGIYGTFGEVLTQFKRFYEQSGGLVDLMIAPRLYGYGDVKRFDCSNENDIQELIGYCRNIADHHVKHIMIRVDDVVPQVKGEYPFTSKNEELAFKSLGQAHGYLMSRLYNALKYDYPDLEWSFCPVPYSINAHRATEHPAKEYLADMAGQLPQAVKVVWTGLDVGTPVVTKEDNLVFYDLINNHPQFMWHNPDNLVGILAKPDNLEIYPEYCAESEGYFFANAEGAGKSRNRAADLTYNSFLWNPEKYQPRETYLNVLYKLYGVKNLDEYSKMLDLLHELETNTNKSERLALLTQVEDIALNYNNILDQGWLKSYLEKEIKNANSPTPILNVPTRPLDVVVDGKLNDELWDYAVKFSFNNMNGSSVDDEYATEGKIMYNDYKDIIYLSFTCNTPQSAKPIELERDSKAIVNNDSITLTIFPNSERSCNITFDRYGNIYEQFHWVLDWNPDWEITVIERDGGYTAEMAIPVDAFRAASMPPEDKIEAKTSWIFQATRQNFNGKGSQIFFAQPNPSDKNDKGRFGNLIFKN